MTEHQEHQEQVALMKWAKLRAATLPELELLHAIPNGGLRDVRVARKLQAEGVKAGLPDLFLPVARGGYHGLYVEMKAVARGRVSRAQKKWIIALSKQGYCIAICRGWESARQQIEIYLFFKGTTE